jgi:diacylglycerol kinase
MRRAGFTQHPEKHPTIRAAKDCAAAAIAAALIGILTLAVGLHLLDQA